MIYKKKRKYLLIFLVLVLIQSSIFTSCGSKETDQPVDNNSSQQKEDNQTTKKDTLVFGLVAEPSGFDPQFASTSTEFRVIINIYDALFAYDGNDELQPLIAESYKVSNNGMEYTVKIKENIKFHNGEKLTADDVIYTFDRAMTSPYLADALKHFDKAEKIDEYTVLLKLKYPLYYFIDTLTNPSLSIVCKSAAEEMGEELKTNPIGTGPYKFVNWKTGQEVNLVKYDNYFNSEVAIPNIKFRVITDMNTRVVSLETGEIDMTYSIPKVDADNLKTNSKSVTVQEKVAPSNLYISYNFNKEPFDNTLVRKAISYAINRDDVLILALDGDGITADTLIYPELEDCPDVKMYPHDIKKAKELLAEAGYPDGFKTTIHTFDYSFYMKIAEVVQSQLAKVGIDAEIEVLEMNAYVQLLMTNQQDIFVLGVNDAFGGVADAEITAPIKSTEVTNFQKYNNSEVDDLLVEAKGELDPIKRKEIYTKVMEIVKKDAALVPLAWRNLNIAHNSDIKGLKVKSMSYYKFSYYSY